MNATIQPFLLRNAPAARLRTSRSLSAFTLIELLVVIAIIGILASLLVPGLGKALQLAEASKNVSNLKNVATATITWASDNGGRLPAPEYPGGMVVPPGKEEEDVFPEYWDLMEGGGKWLDGVVFAALYMEAADARAAEDDEGKYETSGYDVNEQGDHLKGTLFESTQSVKQDPLVEDWHEHSYAMNTNLQYDRIHDTSGSEDPWLTEKTLSNLLFTPNAMLYIDCEENLVDHGDRKKIIDTIEERWDGGKAITAFLDGHVDRLSENDIPEADPNSDRESSRFWRGVDAD